MSTMKRFGMGLMVMAMVAGFTLGLNAEDKKAETAKAINEKCPNNGKPINPEKTVEIPVKFCCENCKGKFDKDPLAYLEKVAKAEDGKCPLSGGAAKEATSTLVIGYCCERCQGGAKKDTKAAVAKLAKAVADAKEKSK